MKPFFIILFILSFKNYALEKQSIKDVSDDYFQTYAERKDFKKFMSFYAEQAVVDDLVYGHIAEGKAAIEAFFNWSQGDFKVSNNKPALTITKQIFSDNKITTRGVFNQFEYMGKVMGPWRFIIWQEYDEFGKIIYQEDWINYTPKRDFISGENRNPPHE